MYRITTTQQIRVGAWPGSGLLAGLLALAAGLALPVPQVGRRHGPAQVVARTQGVSGWMRPVRSARGMNSCGPSSPCSGCRQRTSASAPRTARSCRRRGRGRRRSDAGVQVEHDPVEGQRLLGRGPQLLGHRGRALGGGARHQHGELVAAEAGHGVDLPQRPLEPGPDLAEQLVAVMMAEGVVDVLEPVQVEQHQGGRLQLPERMVVASACSRAARAGRSLGLAVARYAWPIECSWLTWWRTSAQASRWALMPWTSRTARSTAAAAQTAAPVRPNA
jgi:hypothetical protein